MRASAGVAAAAQEGLAAVVRGEGAGARAAVIVVCREPSARQVLDRELSRRYGADYRILACGPPGFSSGWPLPAVSSIRCLSFTLRSSLVGVRFA